MKPREQRQLSRLQTWVSGRACLFKEEISRTGRVLLSTSDNKCTRGSSRTAGSKGKSRKVEKNAEDLHGGDREMVSVYWC